MKLEYNNDWQTQTRGTNDSEYLRDLVRRDQAKNAKFSALKAAITEGMNSGLSDKTVPDIMKEVEERMRADGRL